MQAMERLMQGRTTFMIAHRLSTLDKCDMVLEVNKGKIVQVADTGVERLQAEEVLQSQGNG